MISTLSSTIRFFIKAEMSSQMGKLLTILCMLVILQGRLVFTDSFKNASTLMAAFSPENDIHHLEQSLKDFTPAERRQIDIMARTVYGEGRGERSDKALVAIATVILNRAFDDMGRWPTCVIAVSKQKQQFSCWNSYDPNVKVIQKVTLGNKDFRRCYHAVLTALYQQKAAGKNLFQGANHYHTVDVAPIWAKDSKMIRVAQIGRHIFYRA